MFEKDGKYYADWRNATGHRIRKSFKTKRAALTFEAEQKELAHPKQQARGIQQPTSYAPRTSAKVRTLAPAPLRRPNRSSLVLVRSRRKS
jgi:hypothetical protein